jgi:hypothetical protein
MSTECYDYMPQRIPRSRTMRRPLLILQVLMIVIWLHEQIVLGFYRRYVEYNFISVESVQNEKFGLINMTTREAALKFYTIFNGRKWKLAGHAAKVRHPFVSICFLTGVRF